MFTIKSNYANSHFFIRSMNTIHKRPAYLHCDGRVINMCEYFESKEAAQKVLDKYYLKPKHEWKHGDVVKCYDGTIIICIKSNRNKMQIFGLGYPRFNEVKEYDISINLNETAIFLFNIKEKL